MKQGHAEIKGGTVLSPVDTWFIFEVSTPSGTIKVRIARDAARETSVEKVNSLVGKAVDIHIYLSPWVAGTKSGITNYLQSIEESNHK